MPRRNKLPGTQLPLSKLPDMLQPSKLPATLPRNRLPATLLPSFHPATPTQHHTKDRADQPLHLLLTRLAWPIPVQCRPATTAGQT